jgi:Protein of unknown function (DUF3631)
VVSLLRDSAGEISGLAVEACGPAGERVLGSDGRTARKTFALRERGCAEGLFRVRATAQGAMVGYLAEGRLAKVIAVAAVFQDPAIYGAGGRPSLGAVPPPEASVVLVADQRPTDPEQAEQHDRDYERACDRLLLAGRLVRLAEMGCACCKDIDQALVQHGVAEVREWLTHAEAVQLSLDGHARKIAKLRDPLRQATAIRELIEDGTITRGMTGAFRAAVAKYAGGPNPADDDEAPASRPPVEDVLPWPHPVEGAAVLDEAAEIIKRYVSLPAEAADAAALWCAHSHALEQAWFNPRLAICSPVRRCGKTTLVQVLTGLVARPKPTSSVTPAVVFRMIDKYRPTYLIDEADGYLPSNEELRSVLNSGHVRTGAAVDRTETNADGTREPRSFSTWTPLVVAGIGRLPSTLDDRSIKIRLQRKPRSLQLARFRADRVAGIAEIGRKLARFALDNQISIAGADVEPPADLHDRAADNWRPILGLASVAGGNWPERARKAALVLEDVEQAAEDLNVELLADIRQIFIQKTPLDPLFSAELLSALLAMVDRPWPEAGRNGRALTERGMAELLKPFGLRTHKTVRRGKKTAKGYHSTEFKDAFSNYLVPLETQGSQGNSPENSTGYNSDEGSHEGTHEGTHETAQPDGAAAENVTEDVTDHVTPGVTPRRNRKPTQDQGVTKCAPCDGAQSAPEEKGRANGVALDCAGCGAAFPSPTGPGRKPKRCPNCRKQPRIRGADTTERTEFLS